MLIIWLALFVVFLIVEAATVGLASIWFAAGALVALICTAFGGPVWLQVGLFVLVSGVTLFFTRPLAKKYLNPNRKATNADMVLTKVGTVTEAIDNIAGTGTVSVGGKLWSARSLTGEVLDKGSYVRADHIEGVKLIVLPLDPPQPEEPEDTHITENQEGGEQ